MAFCLYCNKEVKHLLTSIPRTFFTRGTKVEYEEVAAHCPICNRELYMHDINDINVDRRLKAYERAAKEKNE